MNFAEKRTLRNSASTADNASNISAKSRFIPSAILECPRLARELPHHLHPFTGRDPSDRLRPLGCIERCSFCHVTGAIDGFHTAIIGTRHPGSRSERLPRCEREDEATLSRRCPSEYEKACGSHPHRRSAPRCGRSPQPLSKPQLPQTSRAVTR